MKKSFLYLYAIGLLLLPLILIILPANFFDNGKSVCLSLVLFNIQCYGCGMTRALQHLIHLDFQAAYTFNLLSFIVLPLLMFVWYKELKKTFTKIKSTI